MKNQDKYEEYGIYQKNKGHINLQKSRKDYHLLVNDLIKVKFAKASRQIRLSKLFFCLGLCISLLFTITAFEWRFFDDGDIVDLGRVSSTFENIIDVPPTEQPPTPQPKIVQPKIIEVPDEEEIIEEIEIDLDIEMVEEQIIDQPVFIEMDLEIQEEKAEEIFTIVEQQPEPIGGFSAFYTYVGENLKYPRLAQRGNIQGRVYIEFVVEKDGSLTDIKTMKGIGGGCDEEACRIIANAPKWRPGKQRGMPVRVKMVIPILFRLEEAL
jgi:protein TonB